MHEHTACVHSHAVTRWHTRWHNDPLTLIRLCKRVCDNSSFGRRRWCSASGVRRQARGAVDLKQSPFLPLPCVVDAAASKRARRSDTRVPFSRCPVWLMHRSFLCRPYGESKPTSFIISLIYTVSSSLPCLAALLVLPACPACLSCRQGFAQKAHVATRGTPLGVVVSVSVFSLLSLSLSLFLSLSLSLSVCVAAYPRQYKTWRLALLLPSVFRMRVCIWRASRRACVSIWLICFCARAA